jgi:hypothetical protein
MQTFTTKLNKNLNNQLQIIDLEETNLIDKAQKSILCLNSSLSKLRTSILSYTFKNEEEEILFFKEIKPGIFSQLIYHVKINNIEGKRPMGSFEIQQKYLLNELDKLTLFFNSHIEFYRYYRTNSIFLDDKLFVRGREDFHFHQDNPFIYTDPDFSTSMDNLVSEIIANDRLEVYLKAELESLSIKVNHSSWGQIVEIKKFSLEWTDNKSALVELIYALHAAGSINKGKLEIKVLAAFFEEAFNMKFTDIYRNYLGLKNRSIPTKYIDSLKTALLRKMEEDC